ncbi:hypothetical protein [Streptomyces sp. NPDC047097]|uniref:hypothetical protein n=1 Tax=Streptomyces sp. NPDC047097 TaxID=3155260 RepID=UPI0033E339A7
MPIVTGVRPEVGVGGIVQVLPASPGWVAVVLAPADVETREVPPGSAVVAWALVEDVSAPGGGRVDPVFLAAGRAWTPDQYQDAFGARLVVQVGAAR